MSKRHTELLARIGLAGAVVPTYRAKLQNPPSNINKLLFKIDQCTTAAIRHFGRVGAENIVKIGARIDKMNEQSCLGKPRSILTFIDFSVELLETSMLVQDGKPAIARIKGLQGMVHISRLTHALVELRHELGKGRNFEICSIAGIKAAEIWERL
jgi:hypothetical protein